VKIIDFGVARGTDLDMAVTTLQTDIGQLIGTLQYMSPEQCAADPHDIDVRSDVYALPGGGIDETNPLQKVEMQGGFASREEATARICPQFTSRLWHYWCTVPYNIGGKYWTIIGFDCPNLDSLPWEQ
jgi:serine/threonine protein kinase